MFAAGKEMKVEPCDLLAACVGALTDVLVRHPGGETMRCQRPSALEVALQAQNAADSTWTARRVASRSFPEAFGGTVHTIKNKKYHLCLPQIATASIMLILYRVADEDDAR
jgi:hypothetical protein